MKQYRLGKKALAEARRKQLMRSLILYAVFSGIALLIVISRSPKEGAADGRGILALVMSVVLVIGFGTSLAFSLLVKLPNAIRSLVITVTEDSIYREHNALTSLRIMKHEVKAIYPDSKGNLIVEGKSPDEKIGISPLLEGIEELRGELEKIAPIGSVELAKPLERKKRNYVLLSILGVITFFTALLTKNAWLGIPAILATIALMVGYLFLLSKEPNLKTAYKVRLMMSAFIFLPLLFKLLFFLLPGWETFPFHSKALKTGSEIPMERVEAEYASDSLDWE